MGSHHADRRTLALDIRQQPRVDWSPQRAPDSQPRVHELAVPQVNGFGAVPLQDARADSADPELPNPYRQQLEAVAITASDVLRELGAGPDAIGALHPALRAPILPMFVIGKSVRAVDDRIACCPQLIRECW